MTYHCELVELPSTPTLTVRTRSSVQRLPQVLGPAWGAVLAHAARLGAAPSDAPFVAYHSMDMEDLDLEVGFAFAEPLVGEGDVRAGSIPGGRAVQCVHIGPYDQVGAAYEALQAWLAERPLAHAGPAYEYYLNDPQDTPPAELRTRVVLPLR